MPAPTLVTTPGDATANSFASLAEYKTYWSGRLFNTAALAASDASITAALIQTGRALNALLVWTGAATLSTQAMTWPRVGMASRNNIAIDQMTIPQDLKDAQSEWAGIYISSDLFQSNTVQQTGIASIKAGPVAITYKNSNVGSLDMMEADFRRNLPELAWASSEVPDFVRNLLVASWYTRQTLRPGIVFEGHR